MKPKHCTPEPGKAPESETLGTKEEKKLGLFEKKSPCQNCPYRKDAPRKLWSIEEFKHLLETEASYFGSVYSCHKKDGSACIGWLMNQDKRGFPSIALRISLSKHKVTREYLDNLSCKSEMFKTVEAMCKTNYKTI